MRNAIRSLCGLIFILAMTVGCGQKGPLFLPGDPNAVQTDIPGQYQSTPSTSTSDDDDDDETKDEDKQQ